MRKIKVAVAIQARKSSSRLPEKTIKKLVGNVTLIDSLIDNCDFCSNHVMKKTGTYSVIINTIILVPEEEKEFWKNFLREKEVQVIGGDTNDVLSRYQQLSNYDWIMRLTSDCPNVPPLAMNKTIFTAIHYNLDYLANSWEDYRTAIDGHDCEIMSNRALAWLSACKLTDRQREHVTLAIRDHRPKTLKLACLVQKEDLSHIKLCIDTEKEYSEAVQRFESAHDKRNIAVREGILVYDY